MRTKLKNRLSIITMITLIVISMFSFTVVKADSNPASWILCKFEDGKVAYNAAVTDLVPYTFRSKSAASGISAVNGGLYNGLLGVAGFDFDKVNEAILGREVNPSSLPEVDPKSANEEAPKVGVFDRFGVAGLRWSSYLGEWKYYQIDACSKADSASKTNFGTYYEGRQEPKSTYNEVSTSRDPRSMQFSRGLFASWGAVAGDMVANGLFEITKFVVTLTIAIVGFAFTDVTTLIGLSASGSGGTTASGMFTNIFNSIFTGFVLITFLITAVNLIYNGLIRRQFRMALNQIFKTVLIFFVAIVMSTNPSYWIGMPNKAATYGQAIALSSLVEFTPKGSSTSLCSTNVGEIYSTESVNANQDAKILNSEFEKASKNIQSMIGCRMWEEFLFKPWVRGQFGVEYEELNVDKLNNVNKDWVGDAAVPLGGGTYANNLAIFQLSTQTNAHAPIGDNAFPTVITGVNADWWRIADTLSNYHEHQVTTTPSGADQSVTVTEQMDADPLPMWEYWIGNNTGHRMGVAMTSIIFAIVGSLGPLVLGLSSAVFGAGITILMIVSPVFLLFGTWAGRGDKIFMGWLSSLINTVIKRILTSILLVVSVYITMSAMNLINTVGVVTSMLLLVILSLVLIKNRNEIMDSIAKVDFGGIFDPRVGFNRAMDKNKRRAQQTSRIAIAGAAGAKAGYDTGQGVRKGAKVGAFHQLRNTMYQSQFGTDVIMEFDRKTTSNYARNNRYCSACGLEIDAKVLITYRDDEGNYYCRFCAEEMGIEDLYETILDVEGVAKGQLEAEEARKTRTSIGTTNSSWLSTSKARDLMKPVTVGDKLYWSNEGVEEMIKVNLKHLQEDAIVFKYNYTINGKAVTPPAVPEPLNEYIDKALIREAWTEERYDLISATYREAWKNWYIDNSVHIENVSPEQAEKVLKEIENYRPAVDAVGAIKKYNETYTEGYYEYVNEDEDLRIYIDGKLVDPSEMNWGTSSVLSERVKEDIKKK